MANNSNIVWIDKESRAKKRPSARFKPGIDLSKEVRLTEMKSGESIQTVAEFIGTDDFNAAFYNRQRFEVDAGRDEEPELWQPIYNLVTDANLPRHVDAYRLGPAGVIFSEVTEGGEVKFATVGESTYAVPIKHYGTGIEYNKDIFMYNEQWQLGIIERQVGVAYNALQNHIHFNPILAYSYAASNQTAASSEGTTLVEKYLRTLENAITAAADDATNPRRGPYILLGSMSNRFMISRMLSPVDQYGTTVQSDAIGMIRNVIIYNGWSGSRGKKAVSYAGVTAGKAYLISLGFQNEDFQAFMKQDLQSANGNPDVSRFILEQTVYDTYFGVYANPLRAVEEITWPTS